MNPIDNSQLLNYREDSGTTGFSPVVTYVYDAAAKEIDVTQASIFPADVYLGKVHVKVHDKFGGEVRGTVVAIPGSGVADEITIDVSTLDASKGLDITATVLANDGMLVADGGAYNIGAAGSLGSWDKQKNAKTGTV